MIWGWSRRWSGTRRQAALAGLTVEFHAEALEHRLDPVIETDCFRVAQEALTNVGRHAQAKTVTVELRTRNGCVHLRVRDDGVGCDFALRPGRAVHGASLGLLSMEERAVMAGGGLEFTSIPKRGCEVHAWFPLKWQIPPTGTEAMNAPVKPLRVILADDHTLVRAGIRALLERLPGVQVVGEADDGHEVLKLVKQHRPEVVLLDITMPGLNGLEAAERMTKEFPNVRVIILSMHNNEEYYWRALKAGAAGYLLKKAAMTELETALQQVARGEVYLSTEISARLLKKLPPGGIADRKSPLEQLTSRQREILQLIAEGQNTKQIAELLNVSPKTVEYHRMKLMNCLNVHDVPGLVRFAARAGLLSQES